MSTLRFHALKETLNRKPVKIEETERRSSLFGSNVFNEATMRQSLTKDAYKGVIDAIEKGTKINRNIADQISSAMKDWALSKGVTHYTHWFQPLTGATAEKHDAFFETIGNGLAIEKFGGGQDVDFGVVLIKNGNLVLTDTFEPPHSVNTGVVQITATRDFELASSDTLDIAVVNFEDTDNIIVSQANIVYSIET